MSRVFVCLVLLLSVTMMFVSSSSSSPLPLAEWRWIDFAQPSAAAFSAYQQNRLYENVLPAGVRVWTPSVAWANKVAPMTFISTPRWKTGVPATLSFINFTAPGRGGGFTIQPYPSFAMNAIGDSNALQSVLGFEIDPFNRLWILDQGRVAGANATAGSIKIVVWDLLRNVEIQRLVFGNDLADPATSFLNDLVLDLPRGFAYISDSGVPTNTAASAAQYNGGLIVYDFTSNTARRVLSATAFTNPSFGFRFQVNGTDALPGNPMLVGADGIALTPDGVFLFWTPLSSREVYRVPTCVLRDPTLSDAQVLAKVEHALTKPGNSDGMTFTSLIGSSSSPSVPSPSTTCEANDLIGASEYQLLATDLEHNAIWSFQGDLARVAVGGATSVTPTILVQDNVTMLWSDSMAFSNDGALLFTTNHLNAFESGVMDFTKINFRLMQAQQTLATPLYSYLALSPVSDSFLFWYDTSSNAVPCVGNPFGIHVVNSATVDECLYTPNDRNSFQMHCNLNPSTGVATAVFAAMTGPGCMANKTFAATSLVGDGSTCLVMGGGASAIASCHNDRTAAAIPTDSNLHTYLWHGYTADCNQEPVAATYLATGVCTSTPQDGGSLRVNACNATLVSVDRFTSSDCQANTWIAQGKSSGAGGDGKTCIGMMKDQNQRIGSANILCGASSSGSGSSSSSSSSSGGSSSSGSSTGPLSSGSRKEAPHVLGFTFLFALILAATR